MPNYGIPQAGPQATVLTEIQPGDSFALFNAESPTAPQASVAFCTGYSPGGGAPAPIIFTIHFASAPTDTISIQGANIDIAAQYQDLYVSTNKEDDYYADVGGFAFYRANLSSQSGGGAVTVIAKR